MKALLRELVRRWGRRRPLCQSATPAPGPPSPLDNFAYNRYLWDRYAREWDKHRVLVETPGIVTPQQREACLHVVGDEWGNAADVDRIAELFIRPYVTSQSVVAEIGVGGGRIALRVAPHVGRLVCFDLSPEMLTRARETLRGFSHVDFVLLTEPAFPDRFDDTLDFVYAFDVFVHLDLHTMWKYLNEIYRMLKSGRHAFLHTANLRAPEGWKLFMREERYSVEGHYFIVPEMAQLLAERAGLRLVKESRPDGSNFYFNRDYLFVLQKPPAV